MSKIHSKLTLRIESPLIKAAKKYSKAHGKSLSKLIADYLSLITKEAKNDPIKPLPITSALKGILRKKKISERDYKEYLEDKYK